MAETTYKWGELLQRKLLALLTRCPKDAFYLIEPSYFTNPLFVDIARVVKEAYTGQNLNDTYLTKTTLKSLVFGSLDPKKKKLRRIYKEIIRALYREKLRDKGILVKQATEFGRENKYRDALVQAEQAVNAGKYEAVHKLLDEARLFGTDADLGVEYWEGIEKADRYEEDRHGMVPTFYFPTLDRDMGGGAGSGELVIVLAAGKVGKSSVLGRVAGGALWRNKNVAIASGELKAEKYRKRIDSMLTGIASTEFPTKVLQEPSKRKWRIFKRLRRRLKRLHGMLPKSNLYIKQFTTGKARVADIERWLLDLRERGVKIDILIVDYLFLFRPNVSHKERRYQIGQTTVDLRGLAVEHQIPVWTATQGRRSTYGKKLLTPEDMAEDISQFWTLDFLIALTQTEEEAQQDSDTQTARLQLVSARDTRSGRVIPVLIDRSRYQIWESKKEKGSKSRKRKDVEAAMKRKLERE